MKKLINFMQFQAVWFLCIFGAAYQFELMAIFISTGIIIWSIFTSEHRTHDYVIGSIAAIMGIVLDSLLISQNLITFTTAYWTAASPLWMTPIWIALALTLQSSMSWLSGRYLLAGILGAISGPFAYWAGVRMGAGVVSDLTITMICISVIWLIVTPALFYISSLLKVRYAYSRN
jgi:hypothetical protein